VLVSPHWPEALPALGLLDPPGLAAAGGLLVSLQNG
jgi:hypothetical protein